MSFGVDVLELRLAVRMLRTLDGLVGRLETVTMLAKQLGHRLVTDSNAVLLEQLARQHDRALHVQRSGDSGSPRVTGSTSFSSAGQTSG